MQEAPIISMRVLFLIDTLNTGGAQRQMVNLAAGLSDKYEIHLLVYTQINYFREKINGSKLILHELTQSNKKINYKIITKIIKLNKELKFNVICTFLFTPGLYTSIASMFIPNIKVVLSERTFEGMVSTFNKVVSRQFYRFADKIVTNSMHQAKVLRSKKYSHKIVYIPNGVSLNEFYPKENKEYKSKPLRVIAIGRVSKLKNTHTIIHCMKELRKRSINIHTTWLGAQYEWVEGQTDYFEECKTLLKKFNLNEQWNWISQSNEVNRILREHDLMIHASFGEGFPNVICEGLASGLPVIASNVFDHPQIVNEGENGYLFHPDNPNELSYKIEKYLQLDIGSKKEMGLKARDTAELNFSNKRLRDNYENLFKSLISNG